jgi:MOSC domain-containing protein YiiM
MMLAEGPVGDTVMDREHHGGIDQAVYAYAQEDLREWERELGRELRPGQFGENLTTSGIDVTGTPVGTIWRVGDSRLQVRAHRTPCSTFQAWLDVPHWVKRFTDHGAPGAYLKVLDPGLVRQGDGIEVEFVPEHAVSVGDIFAGRRGNKAKLHRLLAEDDLAQDLREYLKRELAVGLE